MMSVLADLAVRFRREESGQDVIEYGLLTGIISLGSIAVFASIRTKMTDLYSDWGTEIQDNWHPDDPL